MKYVLLVWLLIGGIGEGIYCSAQNMEKVIRNGMRGLMIMAILSMRMVLAL